MSAVVVRHPNTTCRLCGRPMYRRPFELAKGRRFCSRACRNRAHPSTGPRRTSAAMLGAGNPAWKGGVTYRHRRGNYVQVRYVRAPGWALAMARKDGYVMEHRLVMARLVGRCLTRTETVHHRNHDPLDNRPVNLELWPTNRDHKLWEAGRFVPGVANRVGRG